MKHTPGPWTLGADYPDEIYAGKRKIAEVIGGRWVGSGQHTYEVPGEILANAILMAAAPTLLKALMEIMESSTVRHVFGLGHSYELDCRCQRCEYDQLISDATGEART